MRKDIREAIKSCKFKQVLHLNNLKIGDNDIQEITNAIKTNMRDLHTLNLDSNNLTDEGAIVLGEALHDLHQLRQLSIQYNNIGRDGALAIFSLKNEHKSLEILFHGNQITDVGEMERIEKEASTTRQNSMRF